MEGKKIEANRSKKLSIEEMHGKLSCYSIEALIVVAYQVRYGQQPSRELIDGYKKHVERKKYPRFYKQFFDDTVRPALNAVESGSSEHRLEEVHRIVRSHLDQQGEEHTF